MVVEMCYGQKVPGDLTMIRGYSVAVDALGNAYVTGNFDSPTINFGSYTLTNTGIRNIYLVKYDASGNVLFAKSAMGTEWDEGYSVAVDACGNAYMTGYFDSPTIIFDSFTLTECRYG